VDRVLYDDRFAHPGHFTLLRCGSCRHRWLELRPDPSEIEALYATYYPRRAPGPPAGVISRSSAAAWVPREVAVLDIGCGAGDALVYHRTRGCTVRGVEADAHAVASARSVGLAVEHGVFDPANYAPASFDVVTLDQVLEHFVEPATALLGVHQVLRRGGALILTTPNAASVVARLAGDRWIHWHAPYHLQLFSRTSLALLAERAGFRLDRVRTITHPEWLSYQWVHALTRPSIGRRSRLWAPELASLRVRALRTLRHLGGEAVITRLCDRFDAGDNFVVELRKP
jgi:SAM-dependent methyltransferase